MGPIWFERQHLGPYSPKMNGNTRKWHWKAKKIGKSNKKMKKKKNNFYELWYAICWNEWRLACANACLLLFALLQYLSKSTWCYLNIFNNGNRTRIARNEYDQRKCLNIEHHGTKSNDDDEMELEHETRRRSNCAHVKKMENDFFLTDSEKWTQTMRKFEVSPWGSGCWELNSVGCSLFFKWMKKNNAFALVQSSVWQFFLFLVMMLLLLFSFILLKSKKRKINKSIWMRLNESCRFDEVSFNAFCFSSSAIYTKSYNISPHHLPFSSSFLLKLKRFQWCKNL